MADVAESYQLDLLHVHYAIPHSISALLARQMTATFKEKARRLPFITTLHGTDITLVGADRSYFGITKFSIEQCEGITSISEDLRRDTVDIFGVRKRNSRHPQLRQLRHLGKAQPGAAWRLRIPQLPTASRSFSCTFPTSGR